MTDKNDPLMQAINASIFRINFIRSVSYGRNDKGMDGAVEFQKYLIEGLLRESVSADETLMKIWSHRKIAKSIAHLDYGHKKKTIEANETPDEAHKKPKAIILILEFFCSTSNRDAIVGDLLEQYHEMVTRYGPMTAKIILWRRAIESIASLAWGVTKKFAIVTIFLQVVEWFRKLSS
jgi:hypothetical protein